MRTFLRVVAATAVWLAIGLAASPLFGQTDRGVRLDGDLIIRVGPTSTTTAEARAKQIEGSLAVLLDRTPEGVRPIIRQSETDRTSRMITMGGDLIMTVTSDDAVANGASVDQLAADWSSRLHESLLLALDRRTSPGRRVLAQIRGSIRAAMARLLESLVSFVPSAIAASLVLMFFAALATGVRRALATRIPLIHEPLVQNLLRQMAYYLIWLIGFFVALDAMGFNPQTLVTGLGLTGVALGFALKDILSNLVAGVLIQAFRAFELGDQIVVGPIEGSVERIELRATHIRTYDGRLVLVPNNEVFTSRVINNTASPLLRGSVEVHLAYTEDVPRAMDVARGASQGTHGVAGHPPAYARIRSLNAADVTLEIRFWTDSKRADFTATSAAVRIAILMALKAAGVSLPNPVPVPMPDVLPSDADRPEMSDVLPSVGADRSKAL